MSNFFIRYWKFIFLIFSLFYSLNFIFWSYFHDLFYWADNFNKFSSHFMVSLTLFIGYIWTKIFGDYVITIRILEWGICFISMIIPYTLLQSKVEIRKNLHYLGIGFICMGFGTWNLYSSDTTTLFFLTLITTLIIRNEKLSYKYSAILAVLIALSTLCRLPNLLVYFVVCLSILLKESSYVVAIKHIFFLAVISVLFYFITQSLLIGDTDIIHAARSSFVKTTDSSGTHSIKELLKSYLFGYTNYAKYLLILVPIVLSELIARKYHKHYNIIGISLFFFLTIILKRTTNLSPGLWTLYLSFTVFSIFIILSCTHLFNHNKNVFFNFLLIFLSANVAIAGSDTSLLKLFPFTITFLPIALKEFSQSIQWNFNTKCIFVPIVFLSIISYLKYNVTDISITDVGYYDTHFDKLKFISISKQDKLLLNDFYNDYNALDSKDKLIFYGHNKSHMFYWLTDTKHLYDNSYWMFPWNKVELANVMDVMKHDNQILLFDCSGIAENEILEQLTLIKENTFYRVYEYKQ